MTLISEAYREQLAQKHVHSADFGKMGSNQLKAGTVLGMCQLYDTDSVLDYGCGKGEFALRLPFPITNYDPAIPKFAATPKPHDIVICADVLEHIEPEYLDDVLDDLKRVTKKAGLFIICLVEARKHLPDGRNAHICLLPKEEWLAKIGERFKIKVSEGIKASADGTPAEKEIWLHVAVEPK